MRVYREIIKSTYTKLGRALIKFAANLTERETSSGITKRSFRESIILWFYLVFPVGV